MSYILDALSKSERERRLGEAPDLRNAPDGDAHRTIGRAMTLVAVVAVNLAGLGGLYWLAFDQRETPPEATTVVSVTAAPAPARPAAAQPPSIGVPVAARPQAAIPRPSPSPRPVPPTLAQTPAPAATTPVLPAAAVRRSHPAPRPEVAAPQATSQQPPALAEEQPPAQTEESRAQADDVDPTPWLVELPPEVRGKLPPLSINAYYYASDPKRRFVLIDMVKYREGQRLGGGPLLERIGRDSLYLDADGLRFRVRRP